MNRFIELVLGAILTPGRHSVTRMLASLRHLVRGDASCYHRFLSRARWSLWQVGKILAILVLAAVPADQPILISLDDTGYAHRGPNVYGKGRHRDAVRSTRSHTVWLWGHRWVALAVCVQFPWRPKLDGSVRSNCWRDGHHHAQHSRLAPAGEMDLLVHRAYTDERGE